LCKCLRLQSRTRNESEDEARFVEMSSCFRAVAASPGFFFCERFEVEHNRYDPKDGELYLRRVKPGETLVEARSGTDVQIVRPTWV
jgi:hypothetical protein